VIDLWDNLPSFTFGNDNPRLRSKRPHPDLLSTGFLRCNRTAGDRSAFVWRKERIKNLPFDGLSFSLLNFGTQPGMDKCLAVLPLQKTEVMEVGISCQMCGTENRDGIKFCTACGNALVSATKDAFGSLGNMKTMIAGTVSKAPPSARPREQKTDESSQEELKRTMVGIPSPVNDALKGIPMVKISSAPSSPTQGAGVATGSQSRTVIGMAAVTAPLPTAVPIAKPIPPTGSKPAEHTRNRTMLGMQAPSVAEETAAGTTEKTGLQQAQGISSAKTEPIAAQSSAAVSRSVKPNLDSLASTYSAPKEAAQIKKNPESQPPKSSFKTDSHDLSGPNKQPRKSRAVAIAAVTVSAAALVAVIIAAYFMFFRGSSHLRPTLIPSADGKSVGVLLSFPDAPQGTMVRSVGQNVPVVQGQARIDIPMSQIKLGTNDIALSYVEPGDSQKQMTFPIVLRHLVTDDFSGLAAENPFFTVIFQSAPGISLSVAGKPAQAMGNAYFHKVSLNDIPDLSNAQSDTWMYKLPFQLIDEAGVVEQGEHVAAVPLSRLQIDRPAASALVATDTVTCAGSSEAGAQITVNNAPVGMSDVSFITTVPLMSLGENTVTVVARAPGKAPREVSLKVTRIESFAPAVAKWSEDLNSSLDYPTIGRDPKAQVGKKVKLSGRVVNISTEKGVTAFILYVGKGCPARSKCAVYIVFRGETDAGLQSWVDVLGTVRGTRDVEMKNGVKIDVPAVDAAFVLQIEGSSKTVSNSVQSSSASKSSFSKQQMPLE
jgi:hypothetical protein